MTSIGLFVVSGIVEICLCSVPSLLGAELTASCYRSSAILSIRTHACNARKFSLRAWSSVLCASTIEIPTCTKTTKHLQHYVDEGAVQSHSIRMPISSVHTKVRYGSYISVSRNCRASRPFAVAMQGFRLSLRIFYGREEVI
jgi:hypothetical protein